MFRGFTLGSAAANMLHLRPFNFNYTFGIGTKNAFKTLHCRRHMRRHAQSAAPVEDIGAELRRQLSGDLDNVLLKSLSKEPLARYRSADQMSEDIRHHLQGEPVLATSETLLYRIGKSLQRYRIWVIAAAALAAALGTRVVTIRPVGLLAREALAGTRARFRHSTSPVYIRQILDITYWAPSDSNVLTCAA